jgi:preprotein translocase subunit SecA
VLRAARLLRQALEQDSAIRVLPTESRTSFTANLSPGPSPRRGGEPDSLVGEAADLCHNRTVAETKLADPPGRGSPPLRGEGSGERSSLFFALGLTVIATEPGASRRLDEQLRGRAGRQGDEGLTQLYASLEDETLRFYGEAGRRARALRSLRDRPFLEGRAAARLIADAQARAERLHSGQRQQLFKLDEVLDAQRRAFVRAYDAVLAHPAPHDLLRRFIAEVAAGEAAARPSDPASLPAWHEALTLRYGLPPDAVPDVAPPDTFAAALRAALGDRFLRLQAEWRARWPDVSRAVLLQTATEQWAAHVDALGEVQQQAPTLFSFLSAPVEISYAREANKRYAGFNRLVQAEALANLLTLPLPYERPLPLDRMPSLSDAVAVLPSLADGVSTGRAAQNPVQ